MKRAIGYIRVSREEQAANGTISLQVQRERIEAACAYKGLRLVGWYEDHSTGRNGNRQEYQEALRRLYAGEVDAVVVFRLDRFMRSLRELCALFGEGGDLQKLGVAFVSASEDFDSGTPQGQLMMNMLGVMAEYESQVISARQRAQIQARQQNGEHQGAIPYGWRVPQGEDGRPLPGAHKDPTRWEPVEHEQAQLRAMQAMRCGGSTYAAIAAALNEDGVRAPLGGRWNPSSVRRILRRVEAQQ
jgi:site-specific DNA recombinase